MNPLIDIANQLHALEKRAEKDTQSGPAYNRHVQRIRQALTNLGVTYYSPDGEKYTETRTDVEASLLGEASGNLIITQVIKPIVVQAGHIVQPGIVIVENA